MADVGRAIGSGRAVIGDEVGASIALGNRPLEDVAPLPVIEDSMVKGREVHLR